MAFSIAQRPEKASRHPLFPQVHMGPSGSICICPISAAAPCVPARNSLLITMPPPTPVPGKMPTIFFALRPAPSQHSPRTPRLTSLPTHTARRNFLVRTFFRSTPVRRMFGVITTLPSLSTMPGIATPMARTFFKGMRAVVQSACAVLTIRAMIAEGEALGGVASLRLVRISPLELTSPPYIFVPPTSIPMK